MVHQARAYTYHKLIEVVGLGDGGQQAGDGDEEEHGKTLREISLSLTSHCDVMSVYSCDRLRCVPCSVGTLSPADVEMTTFATAAVLIMTISLFNLD